MTGLGKRALQDGVGAHPPAAVIEVSTEGQDDHGSPTTLEEVYRAHARFVWRALRRFGVAESAIEDVMHEVFLVVHRRLDEFDGRASMTTWLYSIARGVASNHSRGRAREARRIRLVDPKPTAHLDPERAAAQSEAAEFVRGFVNTLDDDKRLVFELVDLEGATVPDVARDCGIKLNTAYSRLRAARAAFQAAVTEWRREKTGERGSP